MQGPQPFHQLQMLTPQHQQQLMLAQQNKTSPSTSDVESRRLRMLLTNQNLSLGKDGLSNSVGDVVPNVGSPLQHPALPRGDPDMILKFEENDDHLEKMTTTEAIRTLTDFYRSSQNCYSTLERVEEMSKVKGTVLDSGGSQASFLIQAFKLTKRSFINMSRDFGYYWLSLVIYVLVTICIGTIYLDVGTSYNAILSDVVGKRIKLEPSLPGGTIRLMHSFSELEQDELSPYLQQSSSNNLATGFTGTTSHWKITSCSIDDGTIVGVQSSTGAPISLYLDNPFHHGISSSVPSSLSSPVSVEAVGNQSSVADSSQSSGQLKCELLNTPNFHPHSLPNYHDNFGNVTSCISRGNMAANISVKPSKRIKNWQFSRVGNKGHSVGLNEGAM